MIRRFIYILGVFTCLFSCSSGSGDKKMLEDILGENLDSLSFDELKQNIVASYAQFSMFHAFLDKDDEDDNPQDYAEEDERTEEPFSIPKAYNKSDFEKGITFQQSFDYPGSVLKIDSEVRERESEDITYFIDRVYFDDGTSDSLDVSISSSHRFDMRKIDSVRITARYKTVKQMRGVELPVDKKQIDYKGGIITLDKAKYNYVEYNMTDDISNKYMLSQAESFSGKILDRRGYMSGDLPPEKMKEKYKKGFKALENIAKGIKEDKYKTKESLLSDLIKKMSQAGISSGSDKYYRSEHYYGNVKSVILYFAEEKVTEDFSFTFRVVSDIDPYNLVWSDDENRYLIINEKGEVVVTSTLKGLQQINGYYYQVVNYNDDMILHLNVKDSRLDAMKPYKSSNIEYLTGDLVCLSYRNKKGILDKDGNELIPLVYDKIVASKEGLIIASTTKKFSIFDKSGNLLFEGNGSLDEFSEGLAIYRSQEGNPLAFIDKNGKNVLSLGQYQEAKSFSDDLAVVKKDGLWGCIARNGSVVVPFVYDEIKDFSNGVTLVNLDGSYGLINTENEIVVPLERTGGYSISENFGKRSYYMNGRTYNESGKLVEDDR